jgi:hypothetical protein
MRCTVVRAHPGRSAVTGQSETEPKRTATMRAFELDRATRKSRRTASTESAGKSNGIVLS